MKWHTKTLLLFVVLAVVYAFINLVLSPPRTTLDQYHMSSVSLRALNATVVLPVIAVWFLALYGYQRLYDYSQLLQDSKEGMYVKQLTIGVLILALWLPISSTASAVLNLVAQDHPGMLAPATITTNYLSLFLPLLALFYIQSAARKLNDLSNRRLAPRTINLMALGLIVAGVAYGFLIANAQDDLDSIYHLPMPLVLSTLAVPYIFSWFMGLLAVFYLHAYSKTVPGVIYRKSWNKLAFGLAWIILCLIALQYTTAVSAKLGDLPLGILLLLIYGLLLLMGLGFALLAAGAKRLKMIEDV